MSSTVSKFVEDIHLPSDDEIKHLISRMGVPTLEARRPVVHQDDKPTAQVNAGSLTSFTQNLKGKQKEDVQNSTLFAQLAANKQHDRMAQPLEWFKFYQYVLENIGWIVPAFSWDEYTSGGSTVKLDTAILGILGAIATAGEVALVAATMGALEKLSDDSNQMRIWNANSNDGSAGNFQIFPVDALPNGDVVMVLCAMQFHANTSHGRFLWWSWSSTSINIKRAATKFVLNESVYKNVRQQIITKLGDKAQQFVSGIDI